MDSMHSLGLNPSHALQHPGFYYYMAAKSTEKRRERYLALIEAEVSCDVYYVVFSSQDSTAPMAWARQGSTLAPGYANEKKVDHLTIILEVCIVGYNKIIFRGALLLICVFGFLAVHKVIRVIQEIQSDKQPKSKPRPFDAMDSIPHRPDLL
jgi:hypothetical protein